LLIPITLLAVTALVFIFMRVLPGDAAAVRCGASGVADQTCIEGLREQLGLDICSGSENFFGEIGCTARQYWKWVSEIFQGDFGHEIVPPKPIADELWWRLGNTVQLGMLSITFSMLIGLPIGVLSAVRAGKLSDYAARFFAILALSIPNFWIGTLIVALPAYFWQTRWVPDWTGWAEPGTHIRILVIAALVLGVSSAGYLARIARSSMLEVMRSDYVRTARAKGLKETLIIVRHTFRPSMITVFTIAGLQFSLILGGSVIIESLFQIQGVGFWIVNNVGDRDFQVIQAIVLLLATWFLVIRLLVDVGYAYIDPRIRY
jgi:peptide/nickel transport system permease protein